MQAWSNGKLTAVIANRFHPSVWFGRVTTGEESVINVLEDLNEVKKFEETLCGGLSRFCLSVVKLRMVPIGGTLTLRASEAASGSGRMD